MRRFDKKKNIEKVNLLALNYGTTNKKIRDRKIKRI